jgi:hypothetical protein
MVLGRIAGAGMSGAGERQREIPLSPFIISPAVDSFRIDSENQQKWIFRPD